MDNNNFEIHASAYLHRIGLASPITDSEDGLTQLHRAQAYSIPFENFDIQLGLNIDLSPQALVDKIVYSRRGGYCFELNGLCLLALRHFEFTARPLLARVHLRGQPTARTHQLNLVTINGRDWIADVGFGADGLRQPIPYELKQVSLQDGMEFRLVDSGPYGTMLQLKNSHAWQDLYSFDLSHVYKADIAMSHHFTQTNPESIFTHSRIATIPNAGGRVSLLNHTLRRSLGDMTEVIELEPGEAYIEALAENFGIQLDRPYESLLPLTP